jgi:glucose/mannose-6-phosphate isomerase
MLDSKETVKTYDRKDMLGAIEQMPKHLSEGLRRGRMSGLPRFVPKEVVLCGMGGSAIGGDLLAEWMSLSSEVPCEVCRTYKVPGHVGKDSLVIVASYSGNTEETLSMLEDARKRRAKVVAISSGGQLAQLADSLSIPFAKINTGLVPRASLGYVFGAMMGIVERSGAATPEKQFQETTRVLGSVNSYCKPSVSTSDNPAKALAHELLTAVPVVVGYDLSRPVAKRWANQLNENSKCMAFSSEIPELDHNEIVGWAKDPGSKGFASIFLEHDRRCTPMRKRIDATKEMIGRNASVYSVDAVGLSPLAMMFSLVMIGDYTSTYLAFLRNEDPSSNDPIDELKAVLSKK